MRICPYDIEGNNILLSAKFSLIKSAEELPSDINQIQPNTVVHGYVCNLIETGCFVRFLGRLTGFSPRSKAMDDHKSDLSGAFYIGQSVRSSILDVNSETARVTLSLKQSCCSSMDATFIQEYFTVEDKIAKLQSSDSDGSELKWVEGFNIGSVIEGKIGEAKDIGVVVSFDKYNDVLGFITRYQLGGLSLETGSVVHAAVLDVDKAERLREREAPKDLELHQTVNAVVEIVKEHYLGYCYCYGLPSPATSGRLLLLNSISEVTETSSSKRAKGSLVTTWDRWFQQRIYAVRDCFTEVNYQFQFNLLLTIYVNDDNVLEKPFGNFKVGQTITARIVGKANQKGHLWDLSIKPTLLLVGYFTWCNDLGFVVVDLALTLREVDYPGDIVHINLNFDPYPGTGKLVPILHQMSLSFQQLVTGYVYKVDREWVWFTISRHVKAQLFILDSACEPNELQQFQERFKVGKRVSGYILNDAWESDPLSGYHEGQFIKCKVLEVSHSGKGTIHIDLSLRFPWMACPKSPSEHGSDLDSIGKRPEKIEDFCPNMSVKGINSRAIVKARVEVTLKKSNANDASKSAVSDFSSLHIGDMVSAGSGVGLCHVSELSDDHIENIQTKICCRGEDSDEDIEETDVMDDEARSIQLTDSIPGMNMSMKVEQALFLPKQNQELLPPLEGFENHKLREEREAKYLGGLLYFGESVWESSRGSCAKGISKHCCIVIPKRGRSMFEGILREYPKRTDLWHLSDQEIRLGDEDVIRALFEGN
ncbi:RNA binding,RNA binding isoform 2 [Hibiscus syriacus]|uniref:RNA binding,RNA binding isoform 2 n=1 Tax=Hibiscus syriacus TaxID=106335 RepID=A0A6A3A8Z1_HIBSY|nr:RNA binding,RNA binding isoform 2 [Hibiscus syriacus]